MSNNYVIYTGSDPVAEQMLHELEHRGFSVYDHELANTATLLVFNTTRNKLKKVIRQMNIAGSYKISIAKIDKAKFFTGLKDMPNDVNITNYTITSPVRGIDL